MSRRDSGRRQIFQEYAKMINAGEDKKLNVVRTIATRAGYSLDKNGNSSFVREVITDLKKKMAEAAN